MQYNKQATKLNNSKILAIKPVKPKQLQIKFTNKHPKTKKQINNPNANKHPKKSIKPTKIQCKAKPNIIN